MNAVTPFTNGAFSVRTVEIDGEPWFVAPDVCRSLGLDNTSQAVSYLDADERKTTPLITNEGGSPQLVNVISEAGLYSLILRSRKDEAKLFKRWITHDVLPAIRKTGSYQVAPKSQAEVLLASAQALVDFERKQQELERGQSELKQATAQIQTEVKALAESRTWDHCPHNAEPISKIRLRIADKHGLPEWVIDKVMRALPFSPKPAGEVRNTHEFALNGHYTVWWTQDVSNVFRAFVLECVAVSDQFATHPYIQGKFKLDRSSVPPSPRRSPARLDA